jgi:hypothetical protein
MTASMKLALNMAKLANYNKSNTTYLERSHVVEQLSCSNLNLPRETFN